jgi:glycosyltransferase involved in cell wall biosynthesis
VEPGDVDALAGALADALRDKNRLNAMGVESRAIVEREFAWTSVVARLLDLYNQVLAGPAIAPRT